MLDVATRLVLGLGIGGAPAAFLAHTWPLEIGLPVAITTLALVVGVTWRISGRLTRGEGENKRLCDRSKAIEKRLDKIEGED